MDIKDDLFLDGMTWTAADEFKTIRLVHLKTINSNTPEYHIFRWIVNAYTIQEQYTCHAFNPTVIIPEDELFCPSKFMIPMIKTSYWYHKPDEAIPAMVKLKQVVIPYI